MSLIRARRPNPSDNIERRSFDRNGPGGTERYQAWKSGPVEARYDTLKDYHGLSIRNNGEHSGTVQPVFRRAGIGSTSSGVPEELSRTDHFHNAVGAALRESKPTRSLGRKIAEGLHDIFPIGPANL